MSDTECILFLSDCILFSIKKSNKLWLLVFYLFFRLLVKILIIFNTWSERKFTYTFTFAFWSDNNAYWYFKQPRAVRGPALKKVLKMTKLWDQCYIKYMLFIYTLNRNFNLIKLYMKHNRHRNNTSTLPVTLSDTKGLTECSILISVTLSTVTRCSKDEYLAPSAGCARWPYFTL